MVLTGEREVEEKAVAKDQRISRECEEKRTAALSKMATRNPLRIKGEAKELAKGKQGEGGWRVLRGGGGSHHR